MADRGKKQPAEPQPPRRGPARGARGPAGAAFGGPPAAAFGGAAGAPAVAVGVGRNGRAEHAAKRLCRDGPASPDEGVDQAASRQQAADDMAEIQRLRAANARLQEDNARLGAESAQQAAALAALRAEHEKLVHWTTPRDFSTLELGIWLRVAVQYLSGRDVAALSSTCRRLRPFFRSAWADGDYQPVAGPDGLMRAPASGRGCLEVRPGDDLQAAVDRCPEGGAIMLAPGTYALPAPLRIDRCVHLFGGGQVTLDRSLYVFDRGARSTAAVATLDGLALLSYGGVRVIAGGLQVSNCEVSARGGPTGIYVDNSTARPAVVGNRVHDCGYGIVFNHGAGGRCEGNEVTACGRVGISIHEVDPSLLVARNSVQDCGTGIRLFGDCPAAFALGPGNEVHGSRQDGGVVDRRGP